MTENKLVLITGGSDGIGKYLATKLLTQNVTVITTSRNNPYIESSDVLHKENWVHQQLDVTSEVSVNKLFSWIASSKKELHVLVNNAGIGLFKPLVDTQLDEWDLVLKTNLTGAFLCCKAAYQLMKQNGGRIINIGSIADKEPLIENTAYGVSKSGLRSLSLLMAEEWKHEKIRVSHVSLGAVNTGITPEKLESKRPDMLNVEQVADFLTNLALLPLDMRIDSLELTPGKRIL